MGATKRILIVDDDPAVHEQLNGALHAPDRDIEHVADGLAGLGRVETSPYDLVIANITIPGLDGLDLLRRINECRPAVRVIMLTETSASEDMIRALRERAFAIFSKPLQLNAVIEMVERALIANPWKDDIILLSGAPHWLKMKLRCKVETADRILQFFREIDNGLPLREKEKIGTAFREILMNAIEHGGESDPNKWVAITYLRTQRALIYYVGDPGQGFSFTHLSHAAVSNPAESPYEHLGVREQLGLRPGGFGILMTRELVDELIYNDKGNEVLLIKYLKKK